MMVRGLSMLLAAGPGLWSPSVTADVIDLEGQAPWEGCGYCHGIDGISPMATFPHLAGQQEAYLRKQLLDFRSGARSNDGGVMATQAEALDDETITEIARYFADQPAPAPTVAPPSARAEALYRGGDEARGVTACVSCHGGSEDAGPGLAGQHGEYLRKQLDDFASGRRANAPDRTMQQIAKALTETERTALAQYLAGLDDSTQD